MESDSFKRNLAISFILKGKFDSEDLMDHCSEIREQLEATIDFSDLLRLSLTDDVLGIERLQ